jgi:hypothetical protein
MIVICDRTGEIGSWKEPFVVPCSRSLRAAMKLVVCAFQILDLSYHLTSIRMVRVDVSSRRSSRVKPFQIPTIVKLSLLFARGGKVGDWSSLVVLEILRQSQTRL